MPFDAGVIDIDLFQLMAELTNCTYEGSFDEDRESKVSISQCKVKYRDSIVSVSHFKGKFLNVLK